MIKLQKYHIPYVVESNNSAQIVFSLLCMNFDLLHFCRYLKTCKRNIMQVIDVLECTNHLMTTIKKKK